MPTKTFPGRLDALSSIREFVARVATDAGLSAKDVYAVVLSVDEACSNIVEHAYQGRQSGEIECECWWSGSEFHIILRDQGEPFDPEAVPEPQVEGPLEQLSLGGAGLFLMRKLMDSVEFEFSPEKGNVLRMVKRRSKNK